MVFTTQRGVDGDDERSRTLPFYQGDHPLQIGGMDRVAEGAKHSEAWQAKTGHFRADERSQGITRRTVGTNAHHPDGTPDDCPAGLAHEPGKTNRRVRIVVRQAQLLRNGETLLPQTRCIGESMAQARSLFSNGCRHGLEMDSLHRLRDGALLATGFMASIVGAGFASGREVYAFFIAPGPSLVTVALAGAGFAVFGVALSDLSARWECTTYRDLLKGVLGRWAWAGDIGLSLFVFLTFSVVEAGGGAFLHHLFGWPTVPSTAALGLVAVAVAYLAPKAQSAVQFGLVACLLGCLLLAAMFVPQAPSAPVSPARTGPLWSVLYVGYNVVLAAAVMPGLVARTHDQGVRRWGALAGGLLIGVAILLVRDTVLRAGRAMTVHPIPMWVAVQGGPIWLAPAFGVALGAATAAALLAYLGSLFGRWPSLHHPMGAGVLWAASLPVAATGLVTLVGTVYPIMGIVSTGLLSMFLLKWVRGD